MNTAAVALLANSFPKGLPHTGPKGELGVLSMPGFNTTGMSDEQAAEYVGTAANMLAESIITALESQFDILPKHETAQLRAAAAEAPTTGESVPVKEGSESGPTRFDITVMPSRIAVLSRPAFIAVARALAEEYL